MKPQTLDTIVATNLHADILSDLAGALAGSWLVGAQAVAFSQRRAVRAGQALEALRWLNIDWDEGVEKGGPHAPYRQSQRREIYAEVLERLIASGAVYESYSTAEEIDARNEAAGRAKQLGLEAVHGGGDGVVPP